MRSVSDIQYFSLREPTTTPLASNLFVAVHFVEAHSIAAQFIVIHPVVVLGR